MLSPPFRTGISTEMNGVVGAPAAAGSAPGKESREAGGISVEIVSIVEEVTLRAVQESSEKRELLHGDLPVERQDGLADQPGKRFGA
jgi:hypothetical protein